MSHRWTPTTESKHVERYPEALERAQRLEEGCKSKTMEVVVAEGEMGSQ
jgi:hypothetical protein